MAIADTGKPSALKAVLFDCDGVLVDSERLTNQLLRDDLSEYGLDMTLEEVMSAFVGGTMFAVSQEAIQLGARLPDDWVPAFYEKLYVVLGDQVEAVPGVSDLLDRLIGVGIRCAVASNGPASKMQITLRKTGLLQRLTPHIYSAQDLENPKPAPDVYLHAAAQLGVAPEACIVVEDSASGARAGVAAGMRCIGYAAEGQEDKLAPHCSFVVRDMAALAERLGV